MIVIDTSSLIGLEMIDVLATVLDEYDVHTTETVLTELQDTGSHDDRHGTAANAAHSKRDLITVHSTDSGQFRSSRIDAGEGSCAVLADEIGAPYLITDDLRALPELQSVTSATVAISPILLKALVKRGVLDDREARRKIENLAAERSWLGAPIFRRALRLFENDRDS